MGMKLFFGALLYMYGYGTGVYNDQPCVQLEERVLPGYSHICNRGTDCEVKSGS